MIFEVGVVDANILGHLYRSNKEYLLSTLFSKIYIDEFIMEEINRRQASIIPMMKKDFDAGFLEVINRQNLINLGVYNLYKMYLNDMYDLFFPSDEGEKRGIALAKSTGSYFFLTDDEKHMDSPYYYISQGIISGLEALAFWDLIYIAIILENISIKEGKKCWNEITSKGYEPPYRAAFTSKMGQCVKSFGNKEWLITLLGENKELRIRNIKLLKTINNNT